MLSEKKNTENLENEGNEQMNHSMREINNQGQNPRGFNIFLAHGISPHELRTIRLLYHLSYLHNNLANNRQIDMSPQTMIQREENWLRAQMNNNMRSNINNYRRNIIIRNPRNNTITLYVNSRNMNGMRQRRFYRQIYYEPNINFLQGFIFGLVLNVFSLCIMMISRPRPKFKIGLMLGMLLSICITFPFMLESK